MRGYQKVAKSCNKFCIPQKYVCKYIYIYVSRPCALCPLLIHILLCHSCDIFGSVCWHPPRLPLIHQPECLAAPSSVLFLFLFVGINPQKLYSASCSKGIHARVRSFSHFIRWVFPLFCGFFCFRTISLGHSELTEKGSPWLRAEWGQAAQEWRNRTVAEHACSKI